jgi:hypothetical protein
MLPARLGVFKRAIYFLATGFRPTAATAASTAATAATAASKPAAIAATAATPLAFVDTPTADIISDIETRSKAPLGLPTLPQPTRREQQQQEQQQGLTPSDQQQQRKAKKQGSRGLADRRAGKGLAPGQWDPSALGAMDKRSRELLERKSYLRNFWYCAGECGLASMLFYESQRMAKQQQCSGG